MSRIIDLTLTLQPGMRGVEIMPQYTVAEHGWNASLLKLYSHCGTHMDAQVHFDAGPETLDQIPPERCMGPAWVVSLPHTQPKALIEVNDLGKVQELLQPDDSLLLRTGWSRHVANPEWYRDQLPRVSEGLARWCVERQVKLLGVEPPSVADVTNLTELTRVHRILLGGRVGIVEGLTNLESLDEEKVYFMALPLKPADGDGSPVRALAFEGVPMETWLNSTSS